MASLPDDCEYLFTSKKTRERLNERVLRHIVEKYTHMAGLNGFSQLFLRLPMQINGPFRYAGLPGDIVNGGLVYGNEKIIDSEG